MVPAQESYNYQVCLTRNETRTQTVKVCEYVNEQQTRTVNFSVCVPVQKSENLHRNDLQDGPGEAKPNVFCLCPGDRGTRNRSPRLPDGDEKGPGCRAGPLWRLRRCGLRCCGMRIRGLRRSVPLWLTSPSAYSARIVS